MSKLWNKFQSPGQALKACLVEKGWTQEDLAHILTISPKHTNEIIKNKKPISVEIAGLLEKVFDYKASEWVILDAVFRLDGRTGVNEKQKLVSLKAEVYKYMPINELIKKGWFKKYKDIEELDLQVKNFWGLDIKQPLDLSFLDSKIENLAFKKSEAFNNFKKANALTWKRKALNYCKDIENRPFDKVGLAELMELIPEYSFKDEGIKKFLKELSSVGVKFVFLSHLSKTYLDGAAFLSDDGPVIGLTGRHDRIDNFWFTLAHEIFHVCHHMNEPLGQTSFFDDTTKRQTLTIEKEADEGAERALMKNKILNYFKEYFGYITDNKVLEFSSENNIHPSIVVGILAFNDKVQYSTSHRFKVTVRDKIPTKYCAEKF